MQKLQAIQHYEIKSNWVKGNHNHIHDIEYLCKYDVAENTVHAMHIGQWRATEEIPSHSYP